MLRSLKYEEQYEKGVRTVEQELKEMLAAKEEVLKYAEKERAEKEKERAEKEKERAEKEKERAEKEKERAEKERALKKEAEALTKEAEARKTIDKMVRNLHLKGFSNTEIADTTGLNSKDIEQILNTK
jgi:penicillin-binding protein 2A